MAHAAPARKVPLLLPLRSCKHPASSEDHAHVLGTKIVAKPAGTSESGGWTFLLLDTNAKVSTITGFFKVTNEWPGQVSWNGCQSICILELVIGTTMLIYVYMYIN